MRTLDCGHTDENYAWPSENREEVCYDCFSNEADDAWWEMMQGLPVKAMPGSLNQTHPQRRSDER